MTDLNELISEHQTEKEKSAARKEKFQQIMAAYFLTNCKIWLEDIWEYLEPDSTPVVADNAMTLDFSFKGHNGQFKLERSGKAFLLLELKPGDEPSKFSLPFYQWGNQKYPIPLNRVILGGIVSFIKGEETNARSNE
jgi:hypothetical protein